MKVLQETQNKNQFMKLASFVDFVAKRKEFKSRKNTRAANAISEEIIGNFENDEISDAVYCYMSANSDAADKQNVANELAAKILAMADKADVVFLAVSVS